jgi:hypothetical protein
MEITLSTGDTMDMIGVSLSNNAGIIRTANKLSESNP